MRVTKPKTTDGNANVVICDECYDDDVYGRWLRGTTTGGSLLCQRCRRPGTKVVLARGLEPVLTWKGVHPSASTTLAVPGKVIWDVNGYYRILGIPVDATKIQIRRAFQAKNGHDDWLLTYIVRQLLNPGIRAAYDSSPWGKPFFDDVIERYVKQKLVDESIAALRNGDESWVEPIDLSHLKNQPEPEDEPDFASVAEGVMGAAWSSYSWETNHHDEESLSEWRRMVGWVLALSGYTGAYSVGWTRGRGVCSALVEVDGVPVFFLTEGNQPSVTLALDIIDHQATSTTMP